MFFTGQPPQKSSSVFLKKAGLADPVQSSAILAGTGETMLNDKKESELVKKVRETIELHFTLDCGYNDPGILPGSLSRSMV